MLTMRLLPLLLLTCAFSSTAAADPPVPTTHADAPHGGMDHSDMTAPKTPQIMPGYGSGGFRITTAVPRAQDFFDNGMQLAHAFAHKAAIAAMAEAVRLDPGRAMCLWGPALACRPTLH